MNIFSSAWISQYGYPFSNSAFRTNDFSFAGDFTCLSPSRLISGRGSILGIAGNSIEIVHEKGYKMKFHLGACTRL